MRKVAALIAVLLIACTPASPDDACVDVVEVEAPDVDGIEWQGDESQCQYVVACMLDLDCRGVGCGVTCLETVFGADDCGCCGDECEDACSATLDAAVEARECQLPGSDGSTCGAVFDACIELDDVR
jgi:hypothetical protein